MRFVVINSVRFKICKMDVGTFFDSFEEFELAFKEYCKLSSIILCISKSETVKVANKI